jgi:Tfp pilus assembly ATPase PilU
MLNYRNENATGHIPTIEDPIEIMHEHKRSIVDPREVGIDTVTLRKLASLRWLRRRAKHRTLKENHRVLPRQ